jgi:hypothetical protein
MISDLDEIPNLEKIDSIKKILLKNSKKMILFIKNSLKSKNIY